MQNSDKRDDPEALQSEFDSLLRDIENEIVPERLLELATRLQQSLIDLRRREESESVSVRS